jgi:hypothetical protein
MSWISKCYWRSSNAKIDSVLASDTCSFGRVSPKLKMVVVSRPLIALFSSCMTLKMKAIFPSKQREMLAQQHNITSQKNGIFSNIAVRTSSLTLLPLQLIQPQPPPPTPPPTTTTTTFFSLSRRHNPLWVCIHRPLAGFSLLFRGS